MKTTVSKELLELLRRATPEQVAAMVRYLRGEAAGLANGGGGGATAAGYAPGSSDAVQEALARIEGKLDGLVAAARLPEKREPLAEGEYLRVFHLFGELLAMGTALVASPARVFDLMIFQKRTKAETAVACKCAASLITRRVATIEAHFGMPMEKLRDFASDIKERQRTVKGDRYAKKKRGAVRDEVEQYDDGDKASLREDDEGFLPEERQSCE